MVIKNVFFGDFKSEVTRGLGSTPTWVQNFVTGHFLLFSCIKDENADVGIFIYFMKNSDCIS